MTDRRLPVIPVVQLRLYVPGLEDLHQPEIDLDTFWKFKGLHHLTYEQFGKLFPQESDTGRLRPTHRQTVRSWMYGQRPGRQVLILMEHYLVITNRILREYHGVIPPQLSLRHWAESLWGNDAYDFDVSLIRDYFLNVVRHVEAQEAP